MTHPSIPPLIVYPCTADLAEQWRGGEPDIASDVIAYTPWLHDADELACTPGVVEVHRLAITARGGPVWLGADRVYTDPPTDLLHGVHCDSVSLLQALLRTRGPLVHLALHLDAAEALPLLCGVPDHQRARLATVTITGRPPAW